MDIDSYREWYKEHYGHEPSAKMVESFLKMYPKPEPVITIEEFFAEPEPVLPKFNLVKEG